MYDTVLNRCQSNDAEPLRMIVCGTAGTGKSFVIKCLRGLLGSRRHVAALTGVAAFNVEGVTLHTLLHLPIHGEFKPIEGERLQCLQSTFKQVDYIIIDEIDEISMVGRRMLGHIDNRLRQAFPQKAHCVLGGCSVIFLVILGNYHHLWTFLYILHHHDLDLGHNVYQTFTNAVVLTRVMRQNGQNREQVHFREILINLRNGTTSKSNWEMLTTRGMSRISNRQEFGDAALHLHPTIETDGL